MHNQENNSSLSCWTGRRPSTGYSTHKCSDQRAVQTLSSHLRFLQSQHFKSLSSSEIMEDELTFPFLVFVVRQSICAEFPFLASPESIYHKNFQITAEKLTLCCFGTYHTALYVGIVTF